MDSWTGIVLALPGSGDDAMASRLPAYLHPIAGRPLVWHTIFALAALDPRPTRILLASDVELGEEAFRDVGVEVRMLPVPEGDLKQLHGLALELSEPVLVVDAAAAVEASSYQSLLEEPTGAWIGDATHRGAAAAWLEPQQVPELLRLSHPLGAPHGVLSAHHHRLHPRPLVRDRSDLAQLARDVRDRLVAALMEGGVTFLLPETVLVDVDVRIGRDTVVYPGAVLEGQTSIGEETVVGPGCRVIDSWVGSGVELKGWNYISHTSVRNRAILEPYVRRGFD